MIMLAYDGNAFWIFKDQIGKELFCDIYVTDVTCNLCMYAYPLNDWYIWINNE